jgi:hypothetical protein
LDLTPDKEHFDSLLEKVIAEKRAAEEARAAEEREAAAKKEHENAEQEKRQAEEQEAEAQKDQADAQEKIREAKKRKAEAKKARQAAKQKTLDAEKRKIEAEKAHAAAAEKAREAEERKAVAETIFFEAAKRKAHDGENPSRPHLSSRSSKKQRLASTLAILVLGIIPFTLLLKKSGVQESLYVTGEEQHADGRVTLPETPFAAVVPKLGWGKPRDPSASSLPNSSTSVSQNERTPSYPLLPKRVELRHVQGTGGGIGYGTNYSTAALLFASQYQPGYIMLMVDARVHRFDNNTYAGNLGVAGRYVPHSNSFCRILGFNLFYDFRQGLNKNHFYNQIGAGIEVLGRKWDFRANCYYPVGRTRFRTKCVFEFDGGFRAENRKCEGVSYGYNAEFGYYLSGIKPTSGENAFLLYLATGPYYLARRCHDHTVGGKVRLRPQYRDYLALDLSYSYDTVFRSVFQAEIIVTIPLYQMFSKKKRAPHCNLSDRQIYQPIERFEVMPLGKRSCWRTNF